MILNKINDVCNKLGIGEMFTKSNVNVSVYRMMKYFDKYDNEYKYMWKIDSESKIRELKDEAMDLYEKKGDIYNLEYLNINNSIKIDKRYENCLYVTIDSYNQITIRYITDSLRYRLENLNEDDSLFMKISGMSNKVNYIRFKKSDIIDIRKDLIRIKARANFICVK